MADLVTPPDLDERNEELIAAEAIARVSGPLTAEAVGRWIETLRSLLPLVESGALDAPLCPELTNANPSSSHTVLLEAQAWLVAILARKLNILPEKVAVEFARLFKTEQRDPTAATTTLRFTVAAPSGTHVVVAAGTEVSTADAAATFTTDEELEIVLPTTAGEVAATRSANGPTLLAPSTLTRLLDPVAFVTAVTNPFAVDSGSDTETLASALSRARSYQRRGERLVSARDIEDAVREDVLAGAGVVRAFPFIKDGDFSELRPGHVTLLVMTKTASPVSEEVKARIQEMLGQAVGSQFIYLKDPEFEDFDVTADIRVLSTASQTATRAAVERNLLAFYSADESNLGRRITRSEIIAVIEGTPGVDRIVPQEDGEILASPVADLVVAPQVLPRLVTLSINPVV
jgi:uncharacterized phage protein gp47/JayE